MFGNSGNGELVYTDVEGQLGIIKDCIEQNNSHEKGEQMEGVENGFSEDVDFGDVQFEDDDEDNENAISVEKLKKEIMGETEPELANLNEGL